MFLKSFLQLLKRPFGSVLPLIIVALVYHKFVRFFIDRKVSEVNELCLEVLWVVSIKLCGKANEPFVIDIDPKGIIRRDQNVNPQVVLVAIENVGVHDIARCNIAILLAYGRLLVNNLNSPSA